MSDRMAGDSGFWFRALSCHRHAMNSADAWRRMIGICLLSLAAGMLVWGLSVLRTRLEGIAFVFYWLSCAVFTLLAMIVALLDLRATRLRAQREHRALMNQTLAAIASAKNAPPNRESASSPATHGGTPTG